MVAEDQTILRYHLIIFTGQALFLLQSCQRIYSIEMENPNTSPTWKIAFGLSLLGPSVEIRTRGLLNPIQARYQTSPHPDIAYNLATAKVY